MANNIYSLEPGSIACTVGGARTVIQAIAPSNIRVKILGFGVAFDGVLTTGQPVVVRLLRQTTAGTMSALTPVNANAVAETIQSTAQHTATVEPTASNVLFQSAVHPQQGIVLQYPYGAEPVIPGGGRVGLEVNVASGQAAINCRPHMQLEE
jgi:hypothetical protein